MDILLFAIWFIFLFIIVAVVVNVAMAIFLIAIIKVDDLFFYLKTRIKQWK